jgi:hypothetical protein
LFFEKGSKGTGSLGGFFGEGEAQGFDLFFHIPNIVF